MSNYYQRQQSNFLRFQLCIDPAFVQTQAAVWNSITRWQIIRLPVQSQSEYADFVTRETCAQSSSEEIKVEAGTSVREFQTIWKTMPFNATAVANGALLVKLANEELLLQEWQKLMFVIWLFEVALFWPGFEFE